MYAYLKGELEGISEDGAIIEVNGIGYNVRLPKEIVAKLPPLHYKVQVFTYTSVREDALQLYGFLTAGDLELFKKLITVNGIGPKVAQGLLAVMDADSLKFAIMAGDVKLIAKAPGIGTKTAERIILDLKDKVSIDIDELAKENSNNVSTHTDLIKNEAVEALVALGYSQFEAAKAVSKVERNENDTVESVLKAAFKYFY
jgi:Holliday junction DNA helicase RuvA